MVTATESTCTTCGSPVDAARGHGRCAACLFAAALKTGEDEKIFGGHELLGEIARGGMGVVYRARQLEPRREVALKTLRGASLDSPEALARFRNEADVMVSLEHPAILPVHYFGEEDGVPFFTMKLAQGGNLAERISDFAGQWRAIAELVAGVAEAVQHAHGRGVLHRDLKPANILFDDAGKVYVGDFGIAKLTAATGGVLTLTASVMGTPYYLAPEVAAKDARAATIASDVWSLGVILYELLAQRRPFEGDSVPALLRAITDTVPAPVGTPAAISRPRAAGKRPPEDGSRSVPRDLAVIAMKALNKDSARRYAAAGALAEDLRCWLAGRPILARPVRIVEKLWLWTRRRPAVAALTVLLAISLGMSVAMLARARTVALEQLRGSLLAQAQAARTSMETGRRAVAIEALRRAAEVAPGADIRDEFISALALPDYAERARLPWMGSVPPALSHDFQTVVTLEQGAVVVRRADGTVLPAPVLAGPVTRLGPFNGDGSLLAVHTATESRVWRIADGTWHEVAPGLFALPPGFEEKFSADGNWLARNSTPAGEGPLEIYSLTRARPVRILSNPWRRSKLTGFSPDSTLLAIRGLGRPEIVVVDALTGSVRHSLRLPETANVRCAAWRRDGKALAIGSENFKIYLWRLTDNPLPPQLMGHAGNLTSVDWNADGGLLVSSAMDGTTRLWDTATGATLAKWPWAGRNVVCSTDGAEFAAEDQAGAATVISRLSAPDFCRELRLPHPDLDERGTAGSWCVEFSPDGNLLLAGDTLGIFAFDAATGKPVGHQPANYCWAVVFPDAVSFYGATRTGVFRWPIPGAASGVEATQLYNGDTNMMASSGEILAIAARKELLLFSAGHPSGRFAAPHRLDRVALHPRGGAVASSFRDKPGLSVWNLHAPADAPRLIETAGSESASCWTRDGRWLLVGDARAVRGLDADNFAEKWCLTRTGRQKDPAIVAVAASADLAAAVIEEGVITLLEPSTGRVLCRLAHPHRRDIRYLTVSPNGTRVAAMTLGHVVQLWDLTSLRRELASEGLDWQ